MCPEAHNPEAQGRRHPALAPPSPAIRNCAAAIQSSSGADVMAMVLMMVLSMVPMMAPMLHWGCGHGHDCRQSRTYSYERHAMPMQT